MISESITRNRFEEILQHLHYNDNFQDVNREHPDRNRLFKIQPLPDNFREAFQLTVHPETHMSIDEIMVPFKGKHSIKVYMPKKPIKWGDKLSCRTPKFGVDTDLRIHL